MLAARHDLPSLLQSLLAPTPNSRPLDPKAASKGGHRALCYAAMGGHIDCLALLLSHAAGGSPHNYQRALQASSSQGPPCGHSPLHHAVKAQQLKAARWLVAQGAGSNSRIRPSSSLYHPRGARIRTPAQLAEERATPLHCAVRVYLRVKEEQQLARLVGATGATGAGAAAAARAQAAEEDEEGDEEAPPLGMSGKEREERAFKLIRWLVEEGRADLLARDARGRTALDVVMASPLYQRTTTPAGLLPSDGPLLPPSAHRGGRDGASSLEGSPTRPSRGLSLSSVASDPGGGGGGGGWRGRIRRSLSFAASSSNNNKGGGGGLSLARLALLRSLGRRKTPPEQQGGGGGQENEAASASVSEAVAPAVAAAAPPLAMLRAASGGGGSSMSLAGLTASLATTTSVRRVAKYLALMQRKQRAVSRLWGLVVAVVFVVVVDVVVVVVGVVWVVGLNGEDLLYFIYLLLFCMTTTTTGGCGLRRALRPEQPQDGVMGMKRAQGGWLCFCVCVLGRESDRWSRKGLGFGGIISGGGRGKQRGILVG